MKSRHSVSARDEREFLPRLLSRPPHVMSTLWGAVLSVGAQGSEGAIFFSGFLQGKNTQCGCLKGEGLWAEGRVCVISAGFNYPRLPRETALGRGL